ncbi:MAG: tRNA adenosine(34) deaminase TadA [Candidatus Omnitrophica bacterium]|nr:tRNA adenosine(34) deaminase TadA [Candidatus Omnitrophota bacterium]
MRNIHSKFMREALKQAKIGYDNGEVPIGAVIVYQNKIIAKSHNQVELLKDPTAHAEILAITQATSYLRCKWLKECTLYVTVEPCLMCAAALVFSRIGRVIFGAYDSKGGGVISKVDINRLKLNYKIKFKGGILEEECAKIVKDFFREKRQR